LVNEGIWIFNNLETLFNREKRGILKKFSLFASELEFAEGGILSLIGWIKEFLFQTTTC
jgi:hypothetical protein